MIFLSRFSVYSANGYLKIEKKNLNLLNILMDYEKFQENENAYKKKIATKGVWTLNPSQSLGNIVTYHWSFDPILVCKLVGYLLKAKRYQHYDKHR
jgi:hypothetical protein